MIQQTAIGLNSREEANPYLKNGMLPLITAPMNTVVNEENYSIFIDNKINVCLPRKIDFKKTESLKKFWDSSQFTFISLSLDEFIEAWCDETDPKMKFITSTGNNGDIKSVYKICIDTANGNMPKLHEAIKKAKELYNSHLEIITGNVGSIEAFIQLAITGVDYIRVGIGGSSVCTTSVHTGVGEDNLLSLIKHCNRVRNNMADNLLIVRFFNKLTEKEMDSLRKVKIIADSTSRFIKDNNLHPNGYAGINQLLYAGADLIMLGNIFNKAYESAGEKYIEYTSGIFDKIKDAQVFFLGESEEEIKSKYYKYNKLYSLYRGMSTQEEQKNYKAGELKHSEGKSIYNKVEYKLSEWINGKENDLDNYPGFVNVLKSAMAYCGSKNLNQFR